MDRNTALGLFLIGAIIIGYSIFNKPSKEELEEAKRKRDSLEMVKKIEEEIQKRQQAAKPSVSTPRVIEEKKDSIEIIQKRSEYGEFGKYLQGEEKYTILENDLIKLKLSDKGGRPYSVMLKNYETYDSLPLVLFDGDSTIFNIQFPTTENRVIETQNLFFKPVRENRHIMVSGQPRTTRLRLHKSEDEYIEYEYTLKPGSYMVDFNINLVGFDNIVSRNVNNLDLQWEAYIPQQEKGKQNENNYTTISYKHYQDDVDKFNARSNKDVQSEDIPTSLRWIAFKDQFFSSVLIADNSFSDAFIRAQKLPEEDKYLKNFRAEMGVPYDGKARSTIPMRFYFGPNHYKTLKQYDDIDLQELVNLGGNIIKFINKVIIIQVFNFLNKYISNYGIIILVLTVIIKLLLLPLTYKSYLSQAKMRVLKPQIDEINERIPKEKAMERQQATMALYKKVGVNPMGGCLPMLLQMPILLAMFRFFPTSIELRQQSFLWAHDLSTYDAIIEWSAQIPIISKFYGNHVSLFTLLMTVSTILSMKMNSQATSSANAQMPGMKGMMYFMPVMFMFVLNNFSAGLTYYYFLANLITFGQNALFKQLVDDEEILKKLHAKKAKPTKKSNFQSRLEKMAKQRGVNLPKK